MVVREDRNRVAQTLARYMRGEIDNFALDTALLEYGGADKTIRCIGLTLWSTYDDLKRHSISVTHEGWKAYRRCIAFLQTDFELPRKRQYKKMPRTWPFESAREIFRSRPRLAPFDLPRFDSNKHSIRLRSPIVVLMYWVMWIVTLAVFLSWALSWLVSLLL